MKSLIMRWKLAPAEQRLVSATRTQRHALTCSTRCRRKAQGFGTLLYARYSVVVAPSRQLRVTEEPALRQGQQ